MKKAFIFAIFSAFMLSAMDQQERRDLGIIANSNTVTQGGFAGAVLVDSLTLNASTINIQTLHITNQQTTTSTRVVEMPRHHNVQQHVQLSAEQINEQGIEHYYRGNYQEMFKAYSQAAQMGYKPAQYNLYRCYAPSDDNSHISMRGNFRPNISLANHWLNIYHNR